MDLIATIPEDIQWTSQPLFQRIYKIFAGARNQKANSIFNKVLKE